MKTIKLDLNLNPIPCTGTYERYTFDHVKVNYTSGKRAYLTAIKQGMKMISMPKLMTFIDGQVFISIDKNKINIGTYEEV